MELKEYLEKYTKVVKDVIFGEETEVIVSIPNECFLSLKDYKDMRLIKFLAKHNITDIESTFSKSEYTFPVANIGFSKNENKWYGWSHRAIFGFTIGDKVKIGDCAYVPKDKDDFINRTLEFWQDECHLNLHADNITDEGFDVVWTYSKDTPNEKIRGTEGGLYEKFPKSFGKGEWTARTMGDAKQMAIDFANSVS